MEIFIKVLVMLQMALTPRRIGQCWRATRAPGGVLPGIEGWLLIVIPQFFYGYPCQNQSVKLAFKLLFLEPAYLQSRWQIAP
jgi:hypothetical protein